MLLLLRYSEVQTCVYQNLHIYILKCESFEEEICFVHFAY